jgi:cell division protein FtsQ
MMRRVVIISVWILLVAGLFSLLGFAYKAHQSIICDKVDIIIIYNSTDIFMTTNDINDFFTKKAIKIKGAPLSDISTGDIESALYQLPFIESADVYTSIDGNVRMTITQRKPILKVFNKYNQSFYIDDKGRIMPSSENYTAHLPVANGNIPNLYNPSIKLDVSDSTSADTIIMQTPLYKIFRLAQFISKDDFWKAMVEEIFINGEGDMELFTKIGDQTVIFGDIDNMNEKFENLLIFYKEGLNKIGWKKYKTINLKYKNQVVCSKINN